MIRTGSEPSLEPSGGTGLLLEGSSMLNIAYSSEIQPAAPAEGLVGDDDDDEGGGGAEEAATAGLAQYHSMLRVGRSSSLAGGLSRDWGHITPSREGPPAYPPGTLLLEDCCGGHASMCPLVAPPCIALQTTKWLARGAWPPPASPRASTVGRQAAPPA